MSGPLRVEALARHYGGTPVFASARFTVKPGEFVAIVGNSGVGKSTLLNCLAGLDRWDAGRTVHGDTNLAPPDETRHTLWQRAHVGFVFQAFHVLPHLDVTQNMALPRMPQARLVEALRQDQGQWCAGINPAVSTWCFHAIWHIKKRLFGPGGVANPRDTTRYRCGLRLARSKNPLFFMGASQRKTLH